MSAEDLKSPMPVKARFRPGVVTGVAVSVVLAATGAMFLMNRSDSKAGSAAEPKPPSEAELRQLQDVAEKGDAVAQNELGEVYLYGRGVGLDSKAAAGWFEKSAKQGNAAAQLSLGMLFDAGQGVPTDYARAIEWYRKAAAQNSHVAQYSLAAMYADGRGVARDNRESTRWLTLAAEQGYGLAEFSLGDRYIRGTGVSVDLVEACKWLTLAEAAKVSDAAALLDEIKPKMNRNDIAEGQKRAREFVPKTANMAATK